MTNNSFNIDNGSILYIHWYFVTRHLLTLNIVEKFHFLMLKKYKVNEFFNKIIFVVSQDDDNDSSRNFIKQQILNNFCEDKVIINFISNNSDCKEKATFKMMIDDLYSNSKDIDYYYIHFKGTSHIKEDENHLINILFWVYLCYSSIFRNIEQGHLGEKAKSSFIHKNPEFLKSQWYYEGVDKRLLFPDYHNSGSFQAYKAKSFIQCAKNLGLKQKDIDNIIDNGTPYVVEWLLTSIFPIEKIDYLTFTPTYDYPTYGLFFSQAFPEYRGEFFQCYMEHMV